MSKRPTAAERAHMDRVAGLPCIVSGKFGVTLHHVTGYADRMGRFSRSHRLIVPLAPEYHLIQHGPKMSVEALGHQGFYQEWGIDLLAEARWLEQESIALGILPELREAA
jgi:hypothetical protein